MIAEKIQLDLNLERLLLSLEELQRMLPIEKRGSHYGGWSVQSVQGSYKEGWSMELVPFNGPDNIGPSWHPESVEEEKLSSIQDYKVPTEAALGEFNQVLKKLESLGLHPRRSRIICLEPGSELKWHQDGLASQYQVRVHIPLLTNENAFFETQEGRFHMPADGDGYLVHTNLFHRATNYGTTPRFHFVSFVWDRHLISRHHRYYPEQSPGETAHHTNTWFMK